MGDRAQAIREFERCRQVLQRMLDLQPSRETVAVYEAIRGESTGMTSQVISHERASGEPSKNADAGPLAVTAVRWEIKKQSDPAAASAHDPRHEPRHEPSI